jgi:NTE family protein
VVGRTSGIAASFYQPLDLAQRWFVEPGLVARSSLEDIYQEGDAVASYEFNEAFGYLDVGRVFGHRAELRAGLRSGGQSVKRDIALPTLEEVDWEGYGGLAMRFTYDSRDAVAAARSGLLARAVYFDSTDWLGAAEDYRRVEGLLSQVLPVGRDVAYLRVAGGSSLGTELPVYDDFLLGGPISFPGFAIGELRAQGYWVASASYSRPVAEISDLFGQTLYLGGMATVGALDDPFLDPDSGVLYSGALLLAGRTPIGPLTLVIAATSESDWQLSFNLGRPIPEQTIMDPVW